MKINWGYIQVLLLVGVIVFLYGFSGKRNAKRIAGEAEVEFTNGKHLFITSETVSNLLIVSGQDAQKQSKDSVNLNSLEQKLNQNQLVANAEVFKAINGKLGARITQREPVARVLAKRSFYIDTNGDEMPLSSNYSARVPLITGVDSIGVQEVYPLVEQIYEDEFLKEYITGLTKQSNGDYILNLRGSSIKINFGEVSDVNQKIKNFKAFYNKAYKDELLDDYSEINLKYINQVVCTKKDV